MDSKKWLRAPNVATWLVSLCLIAPMAGCGEPPSGDGSIDAAGDKSSMGAHDAHAIDRVDGAADLDAISSDRTVDGSAADHDTNTPTDAPSDLLLTDRGNDDVEAGSGDVGPCTGSTGGAIDLGSVVSDTTNLYFIDRSACAIEKIAKSGGAPVPLLQLTMPIHDLAIDGTHLYFTTDSAVKKCATAGCAAGPTDVVSGQGGDRIVTDGTHVYFTSGSSIRRCSVNGCGTAPDLFGTSASAAPDIVTDGVSLFWTDLTIEPLPDDGGVISVPHLSACPLAGCVGAPRQLLITSIYNPRSLSTDGQMLAWSFAPTDAVAIVTAKADLSAPWEPTVKAKNTLIGFRTGPTFTGNGRTYWWDQSRILSCESAGCASMPSLFVAGENVGPSVVASDANAFYWFERATSTFHQCPLEGCSGTVIDAVDGRGKVSDIAASGSDVHWLGVVGLFSCNEGNCALTAESKRPPGLPLSGLITAGPYRYFFEGCERGSFCSLRRAPSKLATTAAIRGTVFGAPITVTLSIGNVAVETRQITADGPFTFAHQPAGGDIYHIDIESTPPAVCRTQTNAGTLTGGDVAFVVSCVENRRLISGTVRGIEGETIVLQNNGTDLLEIHGDGGFSFPTPLAPGADYDVTIVTHPRFRGACEVQNGKGKTTAAGSGTDLDVANILVDCSRGRDVGPLSSALIADNQYLYWVKGGDVYVPLGPITNGAVVRMVLEGGLIEPLTPLLNGVGRSSTAIDANYVYFSAMGSGSINKVPIAGGEVTELANGQASPTSLVVQGTNLFWATATDIVSLDLATPGARPVSIAASPGGTLPTFATRGPVRRLISDNGYLYWVSIDELFRGSVVRAGLHGENLTVLAPRQYILSGGLAVAGGKVFFGGSYPTLMSVPAL